MTGPLTRLPAVDIAQRFWSKVDKRGSEECWPWVAYSQPNGYGQFGIEYVVLLAHRVAWWLINGPIPEGMCILHTCDNSSCVNPAHLFLGTRADNRTDMLRKGRQSNPKGEKHYATKEDVRAIREEYATGQITQRGLARRYGVNQPIISRIVNRRTWRHVK